MKVESLKWNCNIYRSQREETPPSILPVILLIKAPLKFASSAATVCSNASVVNQINIKPQGSEVQIPEVLFHKIHYPSGMRYFYNAFLSDGRALKLVGPRAQNENLKHKSCTKCFLTLKTFFTVEKNGPPFCMSTGPSTPMTSTQQFNVC
jgi:hypothetical protein